MHRLPAAVRHAAHHPRTIKRAASTVAAGHLHPRKGDKVVVAMSGGVDSSVTARLLADQDYDLSAVFMRNWDTRDESGTDRGCEWERDWEDVQRVCRLLDLPCEMIDLSREYWTRVFEPSLRLWETGQTPNPDIWCNREVKFGALMDTIAPTSAWLATGHYARKTWSTGNPPRPQLRRPVDRHKDQTYYLSGVTETALAKALFPLGDLTKPEVRALAAKYDLPTASREESMGICFVGEKRRFSDFLAQYIPLNPGPIVDMTSGREIGKHQGLWCYTVGENARVPGMPERMFVARADSASNTLLVVPGTNHPALFTRTLHVRSFAWTCADMLPQALYSPEPLRARLQFRHRMADVPCVVRPGEDSQGKSADIIIEPDEPQKAIAPGQVAVLYLADVCLGCGIIENTD